MIFTSFPYLVFLPVTALVYFLTPKRFRWIVLLAASMYFYCSASVRYAVYLLITTFTVYGASRLIDYWDNRCRAWIRENQPEREIRSAVKRKAQQKCTAALIACLVLNFGILAVLKYLNFAGELIWAFQNQFGGHHVMLHIDFFIPLGISFYTFQSMGYLMDVYRGMTEVEKNPLKLLLFLSFFPCVLQGPINRYGELAPSLYAGNGWDYQRVARGLQRILWGCFEKLVIADRLGLAVDHVYTWYPQFSGAQLWATMFLYAFQIYADFQGYMDIACGSAEVLGVTIAENFDSPYLSTSIPEFWRRWHISLGSWFRDYLYYPVMRSRLFGKIRTAAKGKRWAKAADRLMTVFALFVVWGLTGLWHGAKTTYVAWGLYHGVLIALSTLFSPLFDRIVERLHWNRNRFSYRMLQTVKTFLCVCVGYVYFRSDSLHDASAFLDTMFHDLKLVDVMTFYPPWLGLDYKDFTVAMLAITVLIVVDVCRKKKIVLRDVIARQGFWFRWLIWLGGIFVVLIYGIYGPDYDAASFIYFAF